MRRTIELCASPTRFQERKFVASLRHSWDYSSPRATTLIHCSTSSWLLKLARRQGLIERRKAAIELQSHSSPNTRDFRNPAKRGKDI